MQYTSMTIPGIIAEQAGNAAGTGVKTCEIRVPALPEVIPEAILYRSCKALLRYTCCLIDTRAPIENRSR